MQAKLENGRVMLSEMPLKDGGNIYVFVGEERRTLGVRQAQQAYDLPSGVQPTEVTSVEYGNEEETPAAPAPTPEPEAPVEGSDTSSEVVAEDKVAE